MTSRRNALTLPPRPWPAVRPVSPNDVSPQTRSRAAMALDWARSKQPGSTPTIFAIDDYLTAAGRIALPQQDALDFLAVLGYTVAEEVFFKAPDATPTCNLAELDFMPLFVAHEHGAYVTPTGERLALLTPDEVGQLPQQTMLRSITGTVHSAPFDLETRGGFTSLGVLLPTA